MRGTFSATHRVKIISPKSMFPMSYIAGRNELALQIPGGYPPLPKVRNRFMRATPGQAGVGGIIRDIGNGQGDGESSQIKPRRRRADAHRRQQQQQPWS